MDVPEEDAELAAAAGTQGETTATTLNKCTRPKGSRSIVDMVAT